MVAIPVWVRDHSPSVFGWTGLFELNCAARPGNAFDTPSTSGDNRGVASLQHVGLWRSWERASMAWKRSSVRSRSGPPKSHRSTQKLIETSKSWGVPACREGHRFDPDQVKTTAFRLQRPAGTPAVRKPAQHRRTEYSTSQPCPAESRRRCLYSAPQACLPLASRSGPPILM